MLFYIDLTLLIANIDIEENIFIKNSLLIII